MQVSSLLFNLHFQHLGDVEGFQGCTWVLVDADDGFLGIDGGDYFGYCGTVGVATSVDVHDVVEGIAELLIEGICFHLLGGFVIAVPGRIDKQHLSGV